MNGQGFFGHPHNGLYVAIDGIRCCGKSTQVRELERRLREKYPELPLLVTKEPGGSEKSEQIRQVLVTKPSNEGAVLTPRTNILLFAASRAQTVETIIEPALLEGKMVLSDRCTLSSDCYQGYGDLDHGCNFGWQFVHNLNAWAVGGVFPDLVIVPEISAELSKERVDIREARNNVYDGRPLEYYQRVAEAYHRLGERMKENIWLIDGTMTVEEQAEIIWKRVSCSVENIEAKRELLSKRGRERNH